MELADCKSTKGKPLRIPCDLVNLEDGNKCYPFLEKRESLRKLNSCSNCKWDYEHLTMQQLKGASMCLSQTNDAKLPFSPFLKQLLV